MKVIVFGASGKVGSRIVNELLEKNHQVTTFVYDNNPFSENDNLIVVKGDVKNEADVQKQLKATKL